MVVMFFAKEETVIFVAAQVCAHDVGQQIDHLMDFSFAHPGDKLTGEAIVAELTKKGDKRLFVRGAIESEEHREAPSVGMLPCENFPPDPAVAWPVEFAEKNALPGAELQAPLMEKNSDR